MRTDHRRQTQRGDSRGGAIEGSIGGVLEIHEHASVLGCRPHGCGFVGHIESSASTPVDLQPGAEDHVLEGRRTAGGHENRLGRLLGEEFGVLRVGARIGLPDPEVNDEMWVQFLDDSGGAHLVARLDEMELRTVEPSAGRVGIETGDGGNPRLMFEFARHQRAELAPHTGDQHPQTGVGGHEVNLVPPSTAGNDPAGQRSSWARKISERAAESS